MRKIVLVILLVLLALTPFSMAQADGLNLDDVQISVDGVPIGDLANAFSGMLTDTVEEMAEESVDMFSMFLDEMADEMTAGLNELENVMGQMGVYARLCANCGDKQIKNIYEEGTLFRNVTAWDAVYEMQTKLRDLGYLNDKPDGCFGAKTEQAVKDFQQDAGLEPNGVACPTTRKLLAEAWAAFMNIETEPAPETAEPVVTEPVVTEPVVTEPVVTEPVVTEPVVTEPVVTEPAPAAPEAAIAVSDTGVCAGNGAETVYCDGHARLLEMKDILLAGADTPEQRVKALEQYAAIWGVELDYLYGEWFELAADADKAMVSNAIAMFAANLEMQEYMWSRMYGEGSEEVVTLVTDMVIAQCHDLCALVAGLNGAN